MVEFQTVAKFEEPPPIYCGCLDPSAPPVGIRHFCVTRPGFPDADGRPRRFMGSALYPAAVDDVPPARLVDVLSPHLAKALEFLLRDASAAEAACLREWLPRLAIHARREASLAVGNGALPVLLCNPGGESSRAACLPLCEALATAGYLVLALDGVRDGPAQVYPDGEINSLPLLPGESPITPRVADLHFLLNCLPAIHSHGPLAGTLDLQRVGALGHSRGGYLANIASVEDGRVRAAANMDGFPWGLWTKGTGLDAYPAQFQAQARASSTSVLRLVGTPTDSVPDAQFDLESRDFGGPFWYVALDGFEHHHFASAPYLCARPADAISSLERMNEHCAAAATLAPILAAFFDTSLRGQPPAPRLGARSADWFAHRPAGRLASAARTPQTD